MQAINASAEVIPTLKSEVHLNKILGIKGFSLEKVLNMDPNFLDVSGPRRDLMSLGAATTACMPLSSHNAFAALHSICMCASG